MTALGQWRAAIGVSLILAAGAFVLSAESASAGDRDGVEGVTLTRSKVRGVDCVTAKSSQGVGVSCDWDEQ